MKDMYGEPLATGDVVEDNQGQTWRVYATGTDEHGWNYVVVRPIHQTTTLNCNAVEKVFGEVAEDYGDYYRESDHV